MLGCISVCKIHLFTVFCIDKLLIFRAEVGPARRPQKIVKT